MMYRAFGLNILSEIKLPPLLKTKANNPDITIKLKGVDKQGLAAPELIKPGGQTAPNEFWFHVPGIARFYITNGDSVHVDPEKGASEQSIRLYLLGTCIGALMHQRKRLVIHGNAVRIGNESVIFAGVSGNGKSTLAAALYQRGYQLLTDDLAVLDENCCVQPAYPQIKIWQDTADKLGIDTSQLQRIRLQIKKYAYPLESHQFCNAALPVKSIYILSTHNRETVDISPIVGMNKFVPLKNQTYRGGHLEGLGLKPQHLKHCAQLANRASVTKITRPKKACDIHQFVSLIEKELGKTERAA